VGWLASHATEIAVSPSVSDYSDLEPFRRAMGSARVVMLGEQSHGDGTTFLAKTRLIQFLHQELGFDILAFECGLFDVRKVWELIEQGEPVGEAMPQGIFSMWSASAQLQPLIQYVEQAARSGSPLQLAGVDCQFTGPASRAHLVEELTAFLLRNGSVLVDGAEYGAFSSQLQVLVETHWRHHRPEESEYVALGAFLERLSSEVQGFPAGDETAFWRQMLESIQQQVQASWYRGAVGLRDEQMGDNLVWLLEQGFPGRKIIVWGATLHAAREISGIIDWQTSETPYEESASPC
jgi:erythromycin esterase